MKESHATPPLLLLLRAVTSSDHYPLPAALESLFVLSFNACDPWLCTYYPFPVRSPPEDGSWQAPLCPPPRPTPGGYFFFFFFLLYHTRMKPI